MADCLLRIVMSIGSWMVSVMGISFPETHSPSAAEQTVSAMVAFIRATETEEAMLMTGISTESSEQISLSRMTETPEYINRGTAAVQQTVVPSVSIPTTTPVPTLSFREILGNPKVRETFSEGSTGFGIVPGMTDSDQMRLTTSENGEGLLIEPKMMKGWRTWRLRPPKFAEGIVEMSFSFLSCSENDEIGILMQSPDYESGNGLYFGINCGGIMTIYRNTEKVIQADASAVLKHGMENKNTLSVQMNDGKIQFNLNGVKGIEIAYEAGADGYSGFYTAPYGMNTLRVMIQSIEMFY